MRFCQCMCVTVLFLFVTLAPAQDAVEVSPEYYSVILENEYVRVLYLNLPCGHQDERHSHPDSLIFYLGDATVEVERQTGEVITADLPRHQVYFQTATTHRVKNIGTTPVRAISIELKQAVGGRTDVELSPAEVAPESNTLVLENERVRVIYTVTPPGNQARLHDHIHMVVYAATDARLRITPAGGEGRTLDIPAGSAVWSPPVRHTVENIGDNEVVLLHVEVK